MTVPACIPPGDAVRHAAGLLPSIARRGDREACRRLTQAYSAAQMDELVFILALAAGPQPDDERPPLVRAHSTYNRYRARGIIPDEMPQWVVKGERAYQVSRLARPGRREQVAAASARYKARRREAAA